MSKLNELYKEASNNKLHWESWEQCNPKEPGNFVKFLHTKFLEHKNEVASSKFIEPVKSEVEKKAQPKLLYHGSPIKMEVLKPKNLHGDPNVKDVVFATPSREFALAYAGKKWGDRDIEQRVNNRRMSLTESRPGALDETFSKVPGYIYHLPSEGFSKLPRQRTSFEVVSERPVKPVKIEEIPDTLRALHESGVVLNRYDPKSPLIAISAKRRAARALEMSPSDRESYINWYLETVAPEVKDAFLIELARQGGMKKEALQRGEELGHPKSTKREFAISNPTIKYIADNLNELMTSNRTNGGVLESPAPKDFMGGKDKPVSFTDIGVNTGRHVKFNTGHQDIGWTNDNAAIGINLTPKSSKGRSVTGVPLHDSVHVLAHEISHNLWDYDHPTKQQALNASPPHEKEDKTNEIHADSLAKILKPRLVAKAIKARSGSFQNIKPALPMDQNKVKEGMSPKKFLDLLKVVKGLQGSKKKEATSLKELGQAVKLYHPEKIEFDRPIGFVKDVEGYKLKYPFNYGFMKNLTSEDDNEGFDIIVPSDVKDIKKTRPVGFAFTSKGEPKLIVHDQGLTDHSIEQVSSFYHEFAQAGGGRWTGRVLPLSEFGLEKQAIRREEKEGLSKGPKREPFIDDPTTKSILNYDFSTGPFRDKIDPPYPQPKVKELPSKAFSDTAKIKGVDGVSGLFDVSKKTIKLPDRDTPHTGWIGKRNNRAIDAMHEKMHSLDFTSGIPKEVENKLLGLLDATAEKHPQYREWLFKNFNLTDTGLPLSKSVDFRDETNEMVADTGAHTFYPKLVKKYIKERGGSYQSDVKPQLPKDIKKEAALHPTVNLYQHQKDALSHFNRNEGNSILAAGVGLGKTLTAVAAAEQLKESGKAKKFLVVTPASLRNNFVENNIKKYTNSSVSVYGSKKEVEQGLSDIHKPPDTSYHVISYEIFRRDPQYVVNKIQPDMVIYDEAHRARNQYGLTNEAMKAIRPSHKYFMALTGSVFNNSPKDIVPLIDAMTAGNHKLGTPEEFEKRFLKKLPSGRTALANESLLREMIKPYIHYVDQAAVGKDANMPTKIIEEVPVEMNSDQVSKYRFIMHELDPIARMKVAIGATNLSKTESQHIFKKLIQARQVSNSLHTVDPNMTPLEGAKRSPKIQKLVDDIAQHLEETPDGQAIAFTNLVHGGIDALHAELTHRGIAHGVFIGKGREPGKGEDNVTEISRQKDVHDYKTGKKKVLILSGAGGEGLDLGNTTFVGMLDGHFNPEVMNQAEARGVRSGGQAHRDPDNRRVLVRRYMSVMPTSFSDKMRDVWEAVSPLSIIDRLFTKDVPVFYNPLEEHKSTDEWIYDVAKKKEETNDSVKEVLRKMGELVETPQQVADAYWQELGPHLSTKTDITMPLDDSIHQQQEKVYIERLRRAFKGSNNKGPGMDIKETAQYLSPPALGLAAGSILGPVGAAAGAAIGAGVSGAIGLAKGTKRTKLSPKALEAAESVRYEHLDDNDLKLMLRGLSVEKVTPNGRRHTFVVKR